MSAVQSQREFGDGPMARGAAAVYHVLVLEFLLILSASPGLILLFSLAPEPSNIPLVALALVPCGPALSATIFAWRAALSQGGLEPARHFVRGYRLNAVGILRWWVPALAVLAVLGIDLAHLDAIGSLNGGARVVLGMILVLVAIVVVVIMLHALVVTSLFELRTRDALKLALHHAGRFPWVTLGALSITVLGLGLTVMTSDWVPAVFGSLFALILFHNAKAIIRDIEENFTV
ncbi:glycosyl transferase [Phytoactinopolyspora endophytica]|uniref:glycosyl transferase n=1 Tax=Phytoactinopolyspora endophytica TaxID=1642495 RepID=UPI00101D20D2|nr:glycosyl transferase [Phytoactinopolyspora endophytica]